MAFAAWFSTLLEGFVKGPVIARLNPIPSFCGSSASHLLQNATLTTHNVTLEINKVRGRACGLQIVERYSSLAQNKPEGFTICSTREDKCAEKNVTRGRLCPPSAVLLGGRRSFFTNESWLASKMATVGAESLGAGRILITLARPSLDLSFVSFVHLAG